MYSFFEWHKNFKYDSIDARYKPVIEAYSPPREKVEY